VRLSQILKNHESFRIAIVLYEQYFLDVVLLQSLNFFLAWV